MTRRQRRAAVAGMMVIIFAGALAAVVALLSARAKSRRPLVDPALLARTPPATPDDGRAHLEVTWTGVAGLRFDATLPPAEGLPAARSVLLVDPYLTRHALPELAFALDADEPTLAQAFPRADAILVSHSHHDHLVDALAVARRTGAMLYGSATTCALAAAQGIDPQRCFPFADQHRFRIAEFDVEVVAHPHGRTAVGVPLPGTVEHAAPGPLRLWDLKMGGAFAFVVRAAERTVYVQTSSGLDDAQLARIAGLAPDLALVGISLRQRTPDFEGRLLGALAPRRIAAIHHDAFFGTVLREDFELLDGVDVRGFERRVAELAGLDTLVRLVPFTPFAVPVR